MAKTARLGITLPDDNTNVTTQFFVDRFREIDVGAETPAGAEAKAAKALEDAKDWLKGFGVSTEKVLSFGVFNDITTSGSYYVESSSTGPAGASGAGHLIVNANGGNISQFFVPHNENRFFSRLSVNGTWSSWSELASVTQEPWKNLVLQNGWVAYGADDPSPQYYKDTFGVVHIKGVIKNGLTPIGTIIATLPAGYRPRERIIVSTHSSTTTPAYSRFAINIDGTITVLGGAVGNTWLYLTCSFRQ